MSTDYTKPGIVMKALQHLTTGLTDKPPVGLTQLAAGGKVSTVDEILVELKQYISVFKNVDETAQDYKKALQARRRIAKKVAARVEELHAAFKASLGKENPELENYGITPNHKAPPPTVEQLAERVGKAKATRLARHTMGKKQKEKIKGQWPPAEGQPPPPAST